MRVIGACLNTYCREGQSNSSPYLSILAVAILRLSDVAIEQPACRSQQTLRQASKNRFGNLEISAFAFAPLCSRKSPINQFGWRLCPVIFE
jgi:hypothetical protein